MIIKITWSATEGYYKPYDNICSALTRILQIENCNVFKFKSMKYLKRKRDSTIFSATGIIIPKLEELIEEKIGIAKVKDIISGLTFEIVNISSNKDSFLDDPDEYVNSIIKEDNINIEELILDCENIKSEIIIAENILNQLKIKLKNKENIIKNIKHKI